MTITTPILHGPASILTTPVVQDERAVGMPMLLMYPLENIEQSAEAAGRHWLAHPTMPRCVSLNWLMVEGFDIDRTEAIGLMGCTRAEFDDGVRRGVMKHARDTDRLRQAVTVWNRMGVNPIFDLVHVDHEPESTPADAGMDQAAFDRLRMATLKAILAEAGIWTSTNRIALEFTQFSNRALPFAVDYNGAPVAFNRVMPKFASSTELYSRHPVNVDGDRHWQPDPLVFAKLALWLEVCDDPAFPLIDACFDRYTDHALSVCDYHGATPIVYVDPEFGPTPENQCAWLGEALARRSG